MNGMSGKDNAKDNGKVGRGMPPLSTRFQPGQSGNPKGRPKGSKREAPYEAVLGQMVTVRDDEGSRQVTAAEAFLLHMMRKGLSGDSSAASRMLGAIEEISGRRALTTLQRPTRIVMVPVTPGCVNLVMIKLRMAQKLDRCGTSARMVIKPWLVEAALARFGKKRLTYDEQQVVWQATQTPKKVKWPEWWEYRGD